MTRSTWRSICHARAVTIALSLVRQSISLGCATGVDASREIQYYPRKRGYERLPIFGKLTSVTRIYESDTKNCVKEYMENFGDCASLKIKEQASCYPLLLIDLRSILRY